MKHRLAAAAAAIAAIVMTSLTACGGEEGAQGPAPDPPDVIVAAASSLTSAFTTYADRYLGGEVRYSFAGSDELAAQIRQGVTPDVYAAANTALPDALHEEGLVEEPVVFAANQLVIAVPAEGGSVHSLADLERPGVTIAIGSESVPIGSYTREVLSRLSPAREQAILANVRSNEPDVKGIVGKLTQGAVDAGLVYLTDVRAAGKQLGTILLPSGLRPEVAYAAAVVEGAPHRAQARRFIAGLLHGRGLRAMRAAGFELPPEE